MKTRIDGTGLSLFVIFVFVFGCSAENTSGLATGQTYGGAGGQIDTGKGTAGNGTAGTNQTKNTATGGQGGNTPQAGWNTPDNPDDLADNCASLSVAAKKIEKQVEKEVAVEVKEMQPVSIYIMLDQSGSMWIPDITLAFKWIVASDAVTAFINDPESAGINVALGFFPIGGATCDGAMYEVPAAPMGRLPDNASTIADALLFYLAFGSGTPVEPALIGATNYCAQFKQDPTANPDGEDCVVVLITDGMPSDCNTDPTYLAGIASNAYNNNGVMSFIVSMSGGDFIVLNQLAEAGQGGNDCHPDDDLYYACNVSLPGMSLLKALELIRSYVVREEIQIVYETVYETEVMDCEWEIPAPPPNEEFNKDKVNVKFSPTGQPTDTITIPRAENAAACANNVAWQYSDDGTRIVACPPACSQIQAAESGTIDIVLGCEVEVIIE